MTSHEMAIVDDFLKIFVGFDHAGFNVCAIDWLEPVVSTTHELLSDLQVHLTDHTKHLSSQSERRSGQKRLQVLEFFPVETLILDRTLFSPGLDCVASGAEVSWAPRNSEVLALEADLCVAMLLDGLWDEWILPLCLRAIFWARGAEAGQTKLVRSWREQASWFMSLMHPADFSESLMMHTSLEYFTKGPRHGCVSLWTNRQPKNGCES